VTKSAGCVLLHLRCAGQSLCSRTGTDRRSLGHGLAPCHDRGRQVDARPFADMRAPRRSHIRVHAPRRNMRKRVWCFGVLDRRRSIAITHRPRRCLTLSAYVAGR
jgi:hypothetical protein